MTIASFLKFVEIRTKLASVTPFVIGTLYTLYRYDRFRLENFLIMFISLLSFDMATTAINNYIDYKKANNKKGHNYEEENAIVRHGIKESTALAVVFGLLIVAVTFGVILTLKTDVVVLLMGILCFSIGIIYTFGPIPLSRMPLGEIFSGFFMGFFIMFLAIYIHVFDMDIVMFSLAGNMLGISINFIEILTIFLISIPAITGIGNIMLANNICDVEEDILNKRYTLPHHIGRDNALKLFRALYYIGYISIIVAVILKIGPLIELLALLTLPKLNKNLKAFEKNPSKAKTFGLAVQNFIIINGSIAILLGIDVMFYKL